MDEERKRRKEEKKREKRTKIRKLESAKVVGIESKKHYLHI